MMLSTPVEQYNPLPTKIQILQRLFEDKAITFEELWVLLDQVDSRFVVMGPVQETLPYTFTTTSTQ